MNENEILHKGTVVKAGKDYGFIAADSISGEDIYFKTEWFKGSPPLQKGESVSFAIVEYKNGLQTSNLKRQNISDNKTLKPTSDYLLQWAYMGYLPRTLNKLKDLALPERWEFKNTPQDPDHPFPILLSYLLQTYARLVLEDKIAISEDKQFAAFNTGLIDSRYETIFAIFHRNNSSETAWELSDFCIAGEGSAGHNIVRHFNPLPEQAHYFESPTDLLYDVRKGAPELDWNHLVIERIDRYPHEFLEENFPAGFGLKQIKNLKYDERQQYTKELQIAVQNDNKTYRRIMNRVRDAVDLSIKRVTWNFKTAIPHYYPNVQRLQLLLPLCLVSDEHVDLALAVETTPAGSYLGHTALPLDWAYKSARLICRPDSDWLEPTEIQGDDFGEDEMI